MSTFNPVGYGLIGAGAFGRFCVEQYRSLETVRCLAVADVSAESAASAAHDLGLEACASVDELLGRSDIELVHLATPPGTHAALAERCVMAGKHVLCEKPLAIDVADGRRMIDAAAAAGRVLATDLIMRYNPLVEAVRTIVHEGLLGEPLRGSFENFAKDQTLGPDHWFWDKRQSGGIFIEHGVHFFDLFAYLLGDERPITVEAAQQTVRSHSTQPNGEPLIEQVHTTARYGDAPGGVLVGFYHGFTQPDAMDRQTMRLLFERGDITLDEWVPTSLVVDCCTTLDTAEQIAGLFGDARITEHPIDTDAGQVAGRHKAFDADGRYRITATVGMDKPALYGQVLRGLLDDQARYIRDTTHSRRLTEAQGLRSLELAAEAEALATRERG
ncbi:MAG: Gfo/Idh/MocA family oxidoreductase [Planctomycetota bacterium]